MRNRFTAMAIAALSIVLAVAGAASAQNVIVETDFESTFANFVYAYDYSGYGINVVNPEDPDGPLINQNVDSGDLTFSGDPHAPATNEFPAATATLTTTDWNVPEANNYTYAGLGIGLGWGRGFGLPADIRFTSGNLSDYTVSFKASVTGEDSGDGNMNSTVLVIAQAPDDDDEDTGSEGYGVNGPLGPLTATPQSFTFNLGDLNPPTNPDYDFTTDFGRTFILILQIEAQSNLNELGKDANNVLTIDDVKFTGPTGTLFAGDFDIPNGSVDGADMLVVQRDESPNGLLSTDYDDVINNFGQPMAEAIGAVPEPATATLVIAGAIGLLARRRHSPRASSR